LPGNEWESAVVPEVTVCVPAYRSGDLLRRTLESILGQSSGDLEVDVGLEPTDAEETIAACGPLLGDPRVRLHVNAERLGFDGNLRCMLARVATPYFLICPHDDILHPRHVEVLLAAIRDRPDASVAYGDTYEVGQRAGRISLDVPDGDLEARLLAFFLPGHEAACWRGLTRSTVLHRPFPTNTYSGFSTEYEWALHLVCEGVALHVARPLLVKYLRPPADGSVSADWGSGRDLGWLMAALEHHRTAMLGSIPYARIRPDARAAIELAAELAMLTRWLDYAGGRFSLTAEQTVRLEGVMASTGAVGAAGAVIACHARLLLARQLMAESDWSGAERLILTTIDQDPTNSEAWVLLGWLHNGAGRLFEALDAAMEADALLPLSGDVRGMTSLLEQRFLRSSPG
jgi:hypothetical protein